MGRRTFVCTDHVGRDPWWGAAQARAVRRHVDGAVLVAAVDEEHRQVRDLFDRSEMVEGLPGRRLPELGRVVTGDLGAADDDVLVFLDGDALPIRHLASFIDATLEEAPLAAICRAERGEEGPDPTFCVTTVGTWRTLAGGWDRSQGRLLELLDEHRLPWKPILRSNGFNLHPLLFGVYGGVVYHHGEGLLHPAASTVDRRLWGDIAPVGTWAAADRSGFFAEVVARQSCITSELIKSLIELLPDFHELIEAPGSSPRAVGWTAATSGVA